MALIGNLIARLKLETVQFEQGLTKATRSLTQTGAALNRLGSDMTQAVTIPLVAAGAAALKFGTDFEDAFTGVKKTVEGTPQQLAKLSEEFKELSTQIPVSASELANIGEIAGQLGIPIEKVKDFTQVISELGDATVLSTEEAATGLAQFLAATGGTADMARDLGNVLVELGNNFATNEAVILDFAKQIGGTASTLGVTQEKVLALSAVLANVGINAERGASAISRVFVEMDKAVSMNTEHLQTFAQVAGQSVEDFSRLFREDAAKAVASFIVGLNKTKEAGGSVSVVLDTLKLDGLRVADSLRRASMSTEAISKAFSMANEQMTDGSALADEVAKRYETISSQLKILKNNFELAFIEVFEAVKPILKDTVIPLLKDFVERIKELAAWFKALPPETQKTIVKWLALAAAAGPVLTFFSKIVFSIKNLLTLLPGMVKGLTLLAGAFVDLELFKTVKNLGDLTAAFQLSWESSMLFRGGVIAAAGALAALGTYKAVESIRALSDETRTLHDVISEQPSLWDNVLKSMNPIQAGIEAVYRGWRALALAWKAWSEGGWQGLWEAINGIEESLDDASQAMNAHQVEVESTAQGYLAFQNRMDQTNDAIQAAQDRVAGILPQYTALKEQLAAGTITAEQFEEEFNKLTDTLPQAGDAAGSAGGQIDNLGGAADAAAKKTKALVENFQNSLQPAQALGEELGILVERFGIEAVVKVYGDRILEAAKAHQALNGKDSLPKTVEEMFKLAQVMDAANAAIKEQNEVMTPWLWMVRDMGLLQERFRRQQEGFTVTIDGTTHSIKGLTEWLNTMEFSLEDAGYSIHSMTGKLGEGITRLEDWKVELDDTSDVLAESERSIKIWAEKQKEATDRAAEFAKNWQQAWNTAVGNVVGRWMDGLLEMKFSFDDFASNILTSLKDLGKAMLKLIIGEIFKPILGAAQQFGKNLAQQIGSWLFGGQGPSGGLFGGISDLFGGKGGGGLFGKITGLFSKGSSNPLFKDVIPPLPGFPTAGGAGAGATGFLGNYSQLFSSKGIMGFLGPGLLGAGVGSLIGDELGGAIGGGIMTALAPFLPGLFTNPITAAIGAGILGGKVLWDKVFKKDAFKSGIKEIQRDFGVAVSKGTLDGFINAIGLSKQQFEPFRKSITGSPAAFEKILLPAAKATNSVSELIRKFGEFSVSGAFKDILAGSGLKYTKSGNNFIVDLSVQAQQAVEGNFKALNDAFLKLFGDSGLADAFGDLSRFLSTTVSEMTGDLAASGEALNEATTEMRRAVSRATGRIEDAGRRDATAGRSGTRGAGAGVDMFGFSTTESWVERQRRIYGDLGSPGNRPNANDALPGVNIFDILDSAYPGWDVGSFQHGGRVPRTGYAYVHEGEQIIPKGKTAPGATVNQSVVINIYSPSEDLARVTREKVIPAIRRELNLGSSGLNQDIVRVVRKNNQGVISN